MMTSFRWWTRPLIAIWPLLVALIAVATVGHDVAMAAQSHDGPSLSSITTSATGGMRETPTKAPEHGALLPTTDSACPPDSCPELLDCGVVRVSNPIPAPIQHMSASVPIAVVLDVRQTADNAPAVTSTDPVRPPGVLRALLQVFLN
jgi:hypothetical protein